MLHGEGRFVWASGESYSGAFCDNTITGLGVLQWADGSVYRGSFERGLRHGQGTHKIAGTELVYRGDWQRGIRSGEVRKGAGRWGLPLSECVCVCCCVCVLV